MYRVRVVALYQNLQGTAVFSFSAGGRSEMASATGSGAHGGASATLGAEMSRRENWAASARDLKGGTRRRLLILDAHIARILSSKTRISKLAFIN
jgi:hypothetical protein